MIALGPTARSELKSQKGQVLPAAWARFSDPATEFEVLRLTSPEVASYLPPSVCHPLSRRRTFLLYASEAAGSPQAFRLDLKTGSSRQLTDLPELDPSTLTMMPDERSFCCFAGRSLYQVNFANLRERQIYRTPEPFERSSRISISVDGVHVTFAESNQGISYVRLVGMARGTVGTVAEVSGSALDPQPRPRRASVLYRRNDDQLWLAHYDASENRQLPTAPGRIAQAMWSPDGRSIYYLHLPNEPRALNALRELVPDTNTDRLIAPTSQFAAFASNGDGSVFVGASGSKGSPHVLLLLRVTRREFTLCEHRASDPSATAPLFSPGSQSILFQSDKHGKPAIYSMHVERLVEKTEQDVEEESENGHPRG
jgi:Tol biopolymer transport system component